MEESVPTQLHLPIERETEILRERTFAGAVKAGNPHTDLVTATTTQRHLHEFEEPVEVLLDVIRGNILGDLGSKLLDSLRF